MIKLKYTVFRLRQKLAASNRMVVIYCTITDGTLEGGLPYKQHQHSLQNSIIDYCIKVTQTLRNVIFTMFWNSHFLTVGGYPRS
jgi:hypothetical protein